MTLKNQNERIRINEKCSQSGLLPWSVLLTPLGPRTSLLALGSGLGRLLRVQACTPAPRSCVLAASARHRTRVRLCVASVYRYCLLYVDFEPDGGEGARAHMAHERPSEEGPASTGRSRGHRHGDGIVFIFQNPSNSAPK